MGRMCQSTNPSEEHPVVAELLVGDHGADWSLSSLSPTPTNCDFTKKGTLVTTKTTVTALECIYSRAITRAIIITRYIFEEGLTCQT